MANTQEICSSFKGEVMTGIHALGPGTGVPARSAGVADTLKFALYLASATTNKANTAYTATGEVSGANYTAGGVTVTQATAPTNDTTGGYWTPTASFAWTTVTLATAFDAGMLYNSSQGNKAIAVYTFGSQTVTAANFTLTMPTNNSTTGLLRLV